jgi:hypothetical protein
VSIKDFNFFQDWKFEQGENASLGSEEHAFSKFVSVRDP